MLETTYQEKRASTYLLAIRSRIIHRSGKVFPFELLHGRDVRGPLDILRETWEASPKSEETVVSHVLETQRRLKEMADIVEENLVIRQGAQKQCSTWRRHIEHLRTILQRIKDANQTVKLAKCQFGMKECVYLGHVVENGIVPPETNKIEAVESFPRPETKREVRGFWGLTGYYRRFIPDYATIALPLTDLTRRTLPNVVQWNEECTKAFETLKRCLCYDPVLKSPDFTQQFVDVVLQTDASDRGAGAVLSQRGSDGEEHPVAYYSRKFLPREERYSTVEKEVLRRRLNSQSRHFEVFVRTKIRHPN
eukprot:Em0022g882a